MTGVRLAARNLTRGTELAGDVEQPHIYPWSTVFRVPTADGPVWFKANSPGTAYEPGLLRSLAQWGAEWTIPVLAVDVSRGWSLLADGGDGQDLGLVGGAGADAGQRVRSRFASW